MNWLYDNWMVIGLAGAFLAGLVVFFRPRAGGAATEGGCCCGAVEPKQPEAPRP